MTANNKTFKILSIDGGGIKGLASLYMLRNIEKQYCKGKPIVNYFDMICGTSTGSIIAMGLSTGKSVDEMIEKYESNATKIFPNHYSFYPLKLYYQIKNFVCQTVGYKYKNTNLKILADEIFGDKKMTEAKNLICIPAYNLSRNDVDITKNPCYGGFTRDKHRLIKDVVMASSAAPTYFPSYKYNDQYYVDGGLYANNPSLIGITEATKYFVGKHKQYTNYKVLSIGNINHIENKNPSNSYSWFQNYFWNFGRISYLMDVIFDANAKNIHNMCMLITQNTENEYVRVELESNHRNGLQTIQLDSSDPNDIKKMEVNADDHMIRILHKAGTNYNDKIEQFFTEEKTYDVSSSA